MSNLYQPVCAVIPPHMLERVAQQQEDTQTIQSTLDQMREIADERHRTLIETLTPAAAVGRKRRNVYDARNRRTLPGKLVMSEHKRRGSDEHVNEAYDGSGATYDFYSEVFGRNSFDGRGARIDSTVHYGVDFANAMWNGKQMVYGDGDGRWFNRFTVALEVIGHELTHAVVQHTAGLAYTGQSGALNEHLCDAFGMLVKQYTLGLSARDSDWLVGVGLFGPRVSGKAVRSMAAPGTAYDDPILGRDPQPSHMRDYVKTTEDNGGVHINSGIPNHAFYRAAIALGGDAWKTLGLIWYDTMTTRLAPNANFKTFAAATVAAAGEAAGEGSRVQRIIADAWADVGLPVTASPRIPIKRRPPTPSNAAAATIAPAAATPKWRDRPLA